MQFALSIRRALTLAVLLCPAGMTAEGATGETEAGNPYIRNFSPTGYQADPSNNDIIIDERGVVYVANEAGVLVYDGAGWQLIELPGQPVVRSLCNVHGTVYVGAQDDLGFLRPDERGVLHFVSLRDYVPEQERGFKGIWEIVALGDTVFFRSYYAVFRWAGSTMKVWKPTTLFLNALSSNGMFFVREWKVGLKYLDGDSLRLFPGGERFTEEQIAGLFPCGAQSLMAVTRSAGVLIHDGRAFVPHPLPADSFLMKSLVFHAIALPRGMIALGTQREGLALLDSAGQLVEVIGRAEGLRDIVITRLCRDRLDGIWVALVNGIARVEAPSPYSHFGVGAGIEGRVAAITRYRGRLFAASRTGVLRLEPDRHQTFVRLPGLFHITHCFASFHGRLLVGTFQSVYVLDGDSLLRVSSQHPGVTCLVPSRYDSSIVYAGTYRGVFVLTVGPDFRMTATEVAGTTDYVLGMVEESPGQLVVGGRSGARRVMMDLTQRTAAGKVSATVTAFEGPQQVTGGHTRPFVLHGQTLLATTAGLWMVDTSTQVVAPVEGVIDSTWSVTLVQVDSDGHLWLAGKRGRQHFLGRLVADRGGPPQWEGTQYGRLKDLGEMLAIYPETDGTTWFGGEEGLGRYRRDVPKDFTSPFDILIRSVTTLNTDSVLYGGTHSGGMIVIPHEFNSLRIAYAATSFDAPGENRFETTLEGFDDDAGTWTGETRRDYTNLPPGEYTFHVRGVNTYGVPGVPDQLTFRILPPWYLTWWADTLYAVAAVGIIILIVHLRVRVLTRRTALLERTVEERTGRIREQADQIAAQAERLKEIDRAKTRFFANISHEFRTPLTLILGPLRDLMERVSDATERERLSIMHRNAARLLQLVNQLLDLSRLEAGGATVTATAGHPGDFMKGVVYSFSSLADQRGILLTLDIGGEGTGRMMQFDHDKYEKIISNLLSNAFKFTPDGGDIVVRMTLPPRSGDPLTISVANSGEGIPESHLPRVFDRFYRVDESGQHAGSGIGLSLVRELVELQKGSVQVASLPGEKTEFTVHLPAHYHEAPAESGMVLPGPSYAASEVAALGTVGKSNGEPTPGQDGDERDVILIVEDREEVREYVRSQLAAEYRVLGAANGREGLDRAIEEVPDLIISDVMMPVMDGFALCRALKSDVRTSHIPVILLTARAAEESRLEGFETGADDYLVKPFHGRELHVRVANLIRLRRDMRKRFSGEVMVQPQRVVVTSVNADFVARAMSVIEAHLGDEDFSVQAFADELHMTPRQLHRKITALVNQTPNEFIRTFRLSRAKQLIEQQAGTVSEVAYRVGFSSLSYFSKCFREQFEILPSQVAGTPESE